eukprot:TRINITY_DN14093_c0_g1_i3.p1 TRINITY_DN14093_c0_g1~~TRINITY_DN14093_c0_g1_i3.p1  ORF type:complete len:721 (-),score=164.64 TRINITY_DN14093_c0_g1_i3:205-2286(-)
MVRMAGGYPLPEEGEQKVYIKADQPSEKSLYDTVEFCGGAFIGGECGRYAQIESLKMLDTDPEKPFDRITKTMSSIFKTPVSLITLVADPSRVWFKSKVGPFGACVERDGSWCNYVLVPTTPEILITEDASKDARLAHNPYVAGDPFIKFYAGAPLIGSRGERYGTLCIVDLKQRAFTAELYSLLINFAALAVEEIEVNKPIFELAEGACANDTENNRHLDLSLMSSREGLVMVDVREATWPVVFSNPSFEASSELEMEDLAGGDFWELFDTTDDKTKFAKKLGRGEDFHINAVCKTSNKPMRLKMMQATSSRLAPSKVTKIPGWVPSEDDPKGALLGLDVEKELVVDIGDRDPDSVPDTKCFWFAIVVSQAPGSEKSEATTASDATTGTPSDISSDVLSSAFGDYRGPSGMLSSKITIGPLLGSGSFGKVYRGTMDGKTVAVKVVDCRCRDGGVTAMQLEEAKLAAELDHPRVVKTLTHGSSTEMQGGSVLRVGWIVQEYCDLDTLTSATEMGWLREERQITAPADMKVVLSTLLDIAEAMAYVHSKSIVHADLTGRNVLLQRCAENPHGWCAKVADFGISRLVKEGDGGACSALGTVTHMPPELLTEQILSTGTDVWSFGIIGWEALFGKRCYGGKSPAQIILNIVEKVPLPWPEGASKDFVSLMSKCLSYDRTERPGFSEIAQDIQGQRR